MRIAIEATYEIKRIFLVEVPKEHEHLPIEGSDWANNVVAEQAEGARVTDWVWWDPVDYTDDDDASD